MQDLVLLTKEQLQETVKKAVLEAITISKRPSKDKYYKPEAAKYLGISVATLNKLMSTQQINYNKIGKRVIFSKKDLDAVLQRTKITKSTATYTVTLNGGDF